MRKVFISVPLMVLLSGALLTGQTAMKQVGLRTGYRGGIFYQIAHETGNAEMAYNIMLGFNNNGVQLTFLRIIYEISLSKISPDLFFAWGYGGHAGFIYTDHLRFLGERYHFQGDRFCPAFGADGWLAAEYRFRDIPLNISLNIKPFVELTIPSFVNLIPIDLGVSISYVF